MAGNSAQTGTAQVTSSPPTGDSAKGYKPNPNLGPDAMRMGDGPALGNIGVGGAISNQPGYSAGTSLAETIERERRALKPGNTSALLSQLSPFEMSVFGADTNKDYFQADPRLFDPSVSPEQRSKNALSLYDMRNKASPWAAFGSNPGMPGGSLTQGTVNSNKPMVKY